MATWSHSDRTLHARLVYCGPASAGKTTNLKALRRAADPGCPHGMLSVDNTEGRTLFFDLLPFELGVVLGYRVSVWLFTVPGPVRFEKTRRVVLDGADGVVFVADSQTSRHEQNVWSLQDLRRNLQANGSAGVPVVYQMNKQDLSDSAPADKVADLLGVPASEAVAAVATRGHGVLEALQSACGAMLARALEQAGKPAAPEELARRIERALSPCKARLASCGKVEDGDADGHTRIVLAGDDVLVEAIRSGTALGEKLAAGSARVLRLERENAELRRQVEALGQRAFELARGMNEQVERMSETARRARDSKTNAAERRELLGHLRDATRAMNAPIRALARLARAGRDDRPLHLSECSPERLAREAIRRSGHKRVELSVERGARNARVDRDRITRILANLIDNAVRFSPQGAPVRLRLTPCEVDAAGRAGPGLAFSVLDRGPGIPERDRDRIFAAFERGSSATDHQPGGIGVGLYEARRLAAAHHGTVEYRPRGGGGSEFTLTIPLHANAEASLLEASSA
jgi:signal transduction histidine kinase